MRKIEAQMLEAISNGRNWKAANTKVEFDGNVAMVFLHGHHIASVCRGELGVNVHTLRHWPTPTTKSRLRALGADVYTRNHVTYLNDEAID